MSLPAGSMPKVAPAPRGGRLHISLITRVIPRPGPCSPGTVRIRPRSRPVRDHQKHQRRQKHARAAFRSAGITCRLCSSATCSARPVPPAISFMSVNGGVQVQAAASLVCLLMWRPTAKAMFMLWTTTIIWFRSSTATETF